MYNSVEVNVVQLLIQSISVILDDWASLATLERLMFSSW